MKINFLSLIFYLLSPLIFAQKVIDLPTAIETAKAQHLGLKTAGLEVEMMRQAEKTAYDLPKTEFSTQYGNVNNFNVDYSLNISQTFNLPTVYRKRLAYNAQQTQLAEKKRAIQERELVQMVKSVYYNLVFLYEKEALLGRQDSLYQQLAKGAEVRLRTGEGKALEKMSADLQWHEIQNLLKQTASELQVQKIELARLLNATEVIEIADKKLTKKVLTAQMDVMQNLQIQTLQQQIAVQKANTQVQKTAYSPDIRLGYYNMQESRNPNLHVAQVGVAIPIFNAGKKASVASSRVGEEVAESQLAYQRQTLENELAKLKMQYERSQQALAYYENVAMPQIQAIEKQLQKAYSSGEIGYVEWTQNRLQTFQIQMNYLQELANYNQIVVALEGF
jgi:cobalt-zinc-cadmium resistance protein CzcA